MNIRPSFFEVELDINNEPTGKIVPLYIDAENAEMYRHKTNPYVFSTFDEALRYLR